MSSQGQSKYVQDRAHSIDKQPKTESHKGRIVAIVLISIIVICGIILMWMGTTLKDAFQTCDVTESPTCYTLTCANETTETCGSYAYRCTGNNTVQCSSNPGVPVTIKSGDNICSN